MTFLHKPKTLKLIYMHSKPSITINSRKRQINTENSSHTGMKDRVQSKLELSGVHLVCALCIFVKDLR